MKTTFSICFYCKQCKVNKSGLAPVELSINVNGERLFVNLPVKFNPKEFNKKRKPAIIEDMISVWRTKVNEVIVEIMKNNLPLTASIIREYIQTGGRRSKTISDIVTEYIELTKTKTISKGVLQKYVLVGEFLVGEFGDREISTINKSDMVKIYEKLKSKYMLTTSAGYMVKVRSMFYYAVDNGYITSNPAVGIKLKKGNAKVQFLTGEEISKIKNLDLSDYPKLDRVRDLLLFQCSIGTAYCDLRDFDADNIEVVNNVPLYISHRQKTGVEFNAVILPMGMSVLKKYNGHLPIISNQKYNEYLKEIQKLAGIKTILTSHILRKTYCNNLLNAGIRVEVVAKCMGHSKTSTTLKHYSKISADTIVNEISKLKVS